MLDNILSFFHRQSTLFSNDLPEDSINFASHMSGVTTDVEVRLLLQKIVDQDSILTQTMLHIDLLCALSRKGCEELERITQLLLKFLKTEEVSECLQEDICPTKNQNKTKDL